MNVEHILGHMRSQEGQTVEELSGAGPLLLVFLRHFGCSFCRQTWWRIVKS